jgi:predicted O-linked N-acetylglucosamine transferase (SPINDLY family)
MANRKMRRQVEKSGGTARGGAVEGHAAAEDIRHIVALFSQNRLAEAESLARKITERFPLYGMGWKCLGVIQKSSGATAESLPAMQKAATLLPDDAEVQSNLGVVYKDLHRFAEAEASYLRALALKPDLVEALNNLGVVLKERGCLEKAEMYYRRALGVAANVADIHSNLGALLKDMGRLAEAESCHRRALALKPDFAKAHFNLGNTLAEAGRLNEAEASYRRAIEIAADYAEALCNLGALLKDLGRLEEAEQYCRRALQVKPDFIEARSVLLFVLNYVSVCSPELLFAEACRYGQVVATKCTEMYSTWQCTSEPVRLRVGLVSGDLCRHPVGYFLEQILAQLDRSRLELFAYSNNPCPDDFTARLKPNFERWQSLVGMADESAAQLIANDGVHVLIDLSGHTSKNRLPVFAYKPAPVQVSWLGYFATTGVSAIDYLLADSAGVSEAQRANFVEKIYYLPETRLCFSAPDLDVPVTEAPALTAGYVTFGSVQNLAKITDPVLTVWSTILASIPDSRLRVQCGQLGDESVLQGFVTRAARFGITADRLLLCGAAAYPEYLAGYSEIDILLDTFPYPGGTTTCEALWMGVPTVTLAGDSLLARQGACLLGAAGLTGWVTETIDDYVGKACEAARNLNELAALRASLRSKVRASALFDAARFARHFEVAFWDMWGRYQSEQGGRSSTAITDGGA